MSLRCINAANNPFRHGQDFLNSTLSHDLKQYSIVYWAPHCQLVANRRTADILDNLLCRFLSDESNPGSAIVIWASLIKKHFYSIEGLGRIEWDLEKRLKETVSKKGTALFIASCFDLQEITRVRAKV